MPWSYLGDMDRLGQGPSGLANQEGLVGPS